MLDLELSMQPVHITTDVSSNLDQDEVYNIMWSSLSVTCDRSVVFAASSVSSTNKTDRHETTEIWNIVESGVKHHQTNKQTYYIVDGIYQPYTIVLFYNSYQVDNT